MPLAFTQEDFLVIFASMQTFGQMQRCGCSKASYYSCQNLLNSKATSELLRFEIIEIEAHEWIIAFRRCPLLK